MVPNHFFGTGPKKSVINSTIFGMHERQKTKNDWHQSHYNVLKAKGNKGRVDVLKVLKVAYRVADMLKAFPNVNSTARCTRKVNFMDLDPNVSCLIIKKLNLKGFWTSPRKSKVLGPVLHSEGPVPSFWDRYYQNWFTC